MLAVEHHSSLLFFRVFDIVRRRGGAFGSVRTASIRQGKAGRRAANRGQLALLLRLGLILGGLGGDGSDVPGASESEERGREHAGKQEDKPEAQAARAAQGSK